MRLSGSITFSLLLCAALSAAEPQRRAAEKAILPPGIPWNGASRNLIVKSTDAWITPAERSGFRTTPDYAETVEWLRKLASADKRLQLTSLGRSADGRDIWMLIASQEGAADPASLKRNGKPTLLAQGGIHAGEIDGKDAGLMLLRDFVTGRKKDLLDGVNLLFVPIFNVDGHERASEFTRVNQRGPENGGWRTTSQNLNLNRDYTKIDTPEMRAMIRALHLWDPELYVDLHVTDGSDYQYDITWGFNGPHAYSPSIAKYLESLSTAAETDLTKQGHIPGPLIFEVDALDPTKGLQNWTSTPRFSHGYADLRHSGAILVENHSLKPYQQRVLGTYVLLESFMRTLARSGDELRKAVAADREARRAKIALDFGTGDGPPPMIDFRGIESRITLSPLSGALKIEYLGRPKTMRVPMIVQNKVEKEVTRPRAYYVPAAWGEVIDRLTTHGIRMEKLPAPVTREVTMYRLSDPKFSAEPFEGRTTVTTTVSTEKRRETFPAGSIRVPTDQPLGDLAAILLEPESGDSFLQWGFFNSILSRTEYIEGYVMEPMAEAMLREDPKLAEEFREKLKEESFRSDSRERLQWFYRRTPFFDERYGLYPVAREE